MRPHEVVVNLIPFQNRGVSPFEASHHLLAVSDLSVESLHLVVVDSAPEPDFMPCHVAIRINSHSAIVVA